MAKRPTSDHSHRRGRPAAHAQDRTERAARDEAKHAPVGLPSGGSFDAADLQKGLDRVADRNLDNRDAEVAKALDAASADGGTVTVAPNALPGHDVFKVESQIVAGSERGTGKDKEMVGETRVTEFRQVYNPDRAHEVGEPFTAATQRSEILSSTRVGSSPAPSVPASVDTGPTSGESGEPGTTADIAATEAAIAAQPDPGSQA